MWKASLIVLVFMQISQTNNVSFEFEDSPSSMLIVVSSIGQIKDVGDATLAVDKWQDLRLFL
jgi:hypothetical protein